MNILTSEEEIEQAIIILKKNKELMDILDFVSKLKLPNYYIAAGCVFQTIWNYYDNKSLSNGIKDIDVIYYNKNDLSENTDIEYANMISNYCKKNNYDYEIDVSNEARMHLWNNKKHGMDMPPYQSSEDAISKWIATIHAIGLTKQNDDLRIYAPYGLSDIYSKTVRPIKHEYNNKEIYDKKAESWSKRFDNINIIEW